jgi:hypothetical protein
MHPEIAAYNQQLEPAFQRICDTLASQIDAGLSGAENKVWHGHPVWFLAGNPIVGYSKQKAGIRLMFWSGADFGEAALNVLGAKFKDASIFYTDVSQVHAADVARWLGKGRTIQWDYKNIIKRKGRLERLDV